MRKKRTEPSMSVSRLSIRPKASRNMLLCASMKCIASVWLCSRLVKRFMIVP